MADVTWKTVIAAFFLAVPLFWLASRDLQRAAMTAMENPGAGIPLSLATERARTIGSVRYELSFTIPASGQDPIRGREVITLTLQDASRPLVLDFAQPRDRILSLGAGGTPVPIVLVNGHIVIAPAALHRGENRLEIAFVAGNEPLNRNDDYLYSLFVPARASLAFPCFDQPDLKARYALTLDIPAAWVAVANGAERDRQVSSDRAVVRFAETEPLPTYLFGFVAGNFKVEAAERGGRRLRMFHRETDPVKVARNREALFDLHAAALKWLEDYTGLPYAFGKFEFILIPAFQFGGMEHAGAILYNASSLMLDETATKDQLLSRASTIAHETSHMWFGDLVTMKWFNDVWMKEVFANFMAAKIVNPSFPEINHELRFLLAHYPSAYEVDRTAGANPIRQRLDNLNEAGSLYGAIIYQKAPIVMRQLESLVGEGRFKDGLREYLRRSAFGNATWLDLIRLLDERTDEDLSAWSHAWVEEPGRPTIRTELRLDTGRIASLAFTQSDPQGRQLVWSQRLRVEIGYADGARFVPVRLDKPRVPVPEAAGLPAPRYVLPNAEGLGYGLFELDPDSRGYLLAHLPNIKDPLTRGSAWVTLWDEMLEARVAPSELMDLALRALAEETDELNVQRVLGYLDDVYWRFLPAQERRALAPRIETALQRGLAQADATTLKAAYFATFRSVMLTPEGVHFLERVWRKQETVGGLTLSENDYTAMALQLAVREVPAWREILQEQLGRIENPDRKARFAFVMPALSSDAATRDRFFASLADAANRRHEPWVLDALVYLHHPLRAAQAEKYIRPSLDLLREIQRTGDIFFPSRWMDSTLGGHNSQTAAQIVRALLAEQPDYPPRLRQIILQSADELFRAGKILSARPVS